MTLSDFRLPALGADMDAGTVVEWKVAPGQAVRRGEVVAVVETDKGAIDVEIFLDGVVREVLVPVGAKVPVGTTLARVETAEAPTGDAPVPGPLATVMAEFRDLVTRARAGRLRASELAAPTVILTSLGEEAPVEAVLAIIQPPQVAIVGAGAVLERPWVVDGAVVPRRVLTLSLAADHRVTDGRLGAQFLGRIAAKLAHPEAL